MSISNNSLLKTQIETLLKTYHAPTIRYSHLAFSSKNLVVLDELAQLLQSLFPSYSVWNGEQPNSSTPAPGYRKQFLDEVFNPEHQGLIIQHPEYWLERWDILEKQAFWSALSESHGGHRVIIIFSEGNKFASINQQYFNPQPLTSTAVTAWVSTKTTLV